MKINILTTPIENSVAQRLCNTLYSIMIGLSLKTIIGFNKLYTLPLAMYLIIFMLFAYFLLDWLSYNAITELDFDDKIKHVTLLSYILSIVSLGVLPVISTHIIGTDGNIIANNATESIVFQSFLFCYFSISTIVSHFLINEDIKKTLDTRRVISAIENSKISNDISFLILDYVSRVIAIVLVVIIAVFGDSIEPKKLVWIYVYAVSIATIGKFVRYEKWLLPKVKRIYGA